MKLMDLVGLGIEPTTGSPVVMLREHDEPHRMLPIFVGGLEATAIGLALSGEEPPRPMTHDLMASLVQSLEGEVDAAEVTELRDGSFFARLALHGPGGDRTVDTRPSDAIALAVRIGAPVFVDEAVLDEAGSLPEPGDDESEPVIDEAQIDEAVEEFRSFLDDIDPAQFAAEADVPATAESDDEEVDDEDGPTA
ncbi:MAG TPA: bifunctional nuclease family protein [Acidimicrobiales bacterium]|nr:bifunctional nuclease family protein [Acidimicrobiales bacterium]